ncbi:putative C-5 cytosine-specific DNA methylase [Streptomyces sp. Tu6071]|uniref:DNA cytosine methyltransferase n=1 Tax=Streptomyces sp. Tu6071 TaxID=355249 RepID=UPI00020E59E5|nr:DNA cytosine methyltransferase [Streptomyces sp. Tu6071]EGJ76105.1 putative C-5 cytosine-specific DNA methylase [Streptomyces sp. Tu6071]
MGLTFTDLFCGAGGSSTGLVAAGYDLRLAANHWQRAVETHAANHPGADHLCADVNNYDMRRLPRTDVLWASPICTEISPAGGRKRTHGQLAFDLEEYGGVADGAWERTRATAYDVIRATEVHRYQAVLCENVLEFVVDWELFEWWRKGMEMLGYNSQIVSASSAHIGGVGNDPAPQWRDRVYVVFTRRGIPLPDLKPSPPAWCAQCGQDVYAVQSWRNGRRVGKYKQQYDYRCPNTRCRHAIVEPYVRPAASIIDWTNLGVRIGDRASHKLRPLAANTIKRIRAGLDLLGEQRMVLTVNHGGHDGRAVPADAAPLASRTVKIGDAVLVPSGAFYVKNYGGNARPVDMVRSITEPFGTITARDSHALAVPQQADDSFIVTLRRNATARPVSLPVDTVTGQGRHHWLVIPYRNAAAKSTAEPLHTLGTRDSAAIASPAPELEDCHYRMIQPREQLLAQRFPTDYTVLGNKGEQTMQAGNAVSCNVAQWIGARVAQALARTSANAA